MIPPMQSPFGHHSVYLAVTCLRWLARLFLVILCLWLLSASSRSLQAAPPFQTVPIVAFNPIPGWSSPSNDATWSVAWGDMNGDGALDLAVSNANAPSEVYLNQGGMLQTTPAWSGPSNYDTRSVAWGDMNGDGALDLAVGNYAFGDNGQPSEVYLNQGGMLQTTPAWSAPVNDYTLSVAWGDMNGDGALDLAVAGWLTKVYLNQGGMLQTIPAWFVSGNRYTSSVAWGDMNGDGTLDLAVGNFSQPSEVYLNQGGMLQATPAWSTLVNDDTSSVAWGDMNGDGALDLAVGNEALFDGQPTKVYLNQGGMLQTTPAWSSPMSSINNGSVAWGDVNGDGALDLTVGNYFEPTKVYLNQPPAHALYARNSDRPEALALSHLSDSVPTFSGQLTTSLDPADFYALSTIRQSGSIPITYQLFHPGYEPMRGVRAYYSLDGSFPANRAQWRVAKPFPDTQITDLSTSPFPTVTTASTHVFNWDVLGSGFFGESDNVVVRLEALPNLKPRPNSVPGPFQRPYVSSQTFPFRVRGTQVRVLQAGNPPQPLSNAIVYRLPANQTRDAEPFQDQRGVAFRTNGQGYLQGYGSLQTGDRLVALLPITHTASYTLYQTSATPALTGLDAYTVNSLGVQTLTVSAADPLLLFNLTVSLEWDARNDATFMTQLQNDLKRTSQILFDVSNGQAALGHVRIYQDKGFWGTANLVILANNGQRPNAVMGGSVPTATVDVDSQGNPIVDAYVPGQVRIGATWNRFGNAGSTLGEDWPRALAHELGHFFFFQADDYIGVSPDHKTIKLVDCQGSIMTDPYDENYSEFVDLAGWTGDCLDTLTQQYMGRSDWQTIKRFYPMLNAERVNPGPSQLPLAVTNIEIFAPPTPTNTLAAPFFNLVDSQNKTVTVDAGRGQAYLFKTQGDSDPTNDYLIALGAPVGDLVQARGAAAGDRLCVFDVEHTPLRIGCLDAIGSNPAPVVLQEVPNWQPQIQVRGVTSNTVVVTVTNSSTGNLMVQLLPALGVASPEMAMIPNGNTFAQTVTAADGAYFGFVRVWVPGSNPRQELILEYTASEAWDARARAWGPPTEAWGARARAWGVPAYAWGARARAWGAPVMSSDGQVSIFPLDNPFAAGQRYTLHTIAFPPALPSWLTAVGQTYRVSALAPAANSAIIFSYLARDVPAGYENDLRIYYSPDEGHSWQRLVTDLDTYRNQASAAAPGTGIYILVATTEVRPAFTPGWNSFGYPVQGARPTTDALAAIAGSYSAVYAYDPSAQRWVMFAPNVPTPFNDPVNTLHALEYAHSYWIYATQPVTLYLGVGSPSASVVSSNVAESMAADAPLAPATYYGWITPSTGFTPTVGMRVSGGIDGVLCGETTIQLLDGKLAYILQVPASNPTAASLPCGARNKEIVFRVDHWFMDHNHVWDNSDAWLQPLNLVRQNNTTMMKAVYLPYIQR